MKEDKTKKDEGIDVVIPLSSESKHDNMELRLALRSIAKNLLDVRAVWIVTVNPPKWLDNVNIIPYRDIFKQNKDANIIGKVIMACKKPPVSDKFIFLSDDQLFLKPIISEEIKVYTIGDLNKRTKFDNNCNYSQRLLHSRTVLNKEKLPALNYESHAPVIYDKNLFQEIYSKYEWYLDGRGEGFTINTMYFNNIQGMNDIAIPANTDKATFEKEFEKELTVEKRLELIKNKTASKKFIGYNDKGFTPEIKDFLRSMFPDPCKYEKPVVKPTLKEGVLEQEIAGITEDNGQFLMMERSSIIAQIAHIRLSSKRLNINPDKYFKEELELLDKIKTTIEKSITLHNAERYFESLKSTK